MYERIISLENLFQAWSEFLTGKKKRQDVVAFSERLAANICSLQTDLAAGTYRHSPYHAFNISDPKPRNIHKAAVRDRLLHHAVYRVLYPYFDKKFIFDSYSCRVEKGTHKALERFNEFGRKVSRNNTRQCWILKCDVRKFFASIDHEILLAILRKHIADESLLDLLKRIIESFETAPGKGLPLGNLTSQLLVNIYMNEFDQWAKHVLKAKYYIRYADDFVFLSPNRDDLTHIRHGVNAFLEKYLKLTLHPDKVFIKTLSSGVDFLGWVHFPHHRVLRTVTKRRMLKNISLHPREEKDDPVRASYRGMLKHGNAYTLQQQIGKL